jgi:hypothetical protein
MEKLLLLSAMLIFAGGVATAASGATLPDPVYVTPEVGFIPKVTTPAPASHHAKTPVMTMPTIQKPTVQHPTVQHPVAVPTVPVPAVVPPPAPVVIAPPPTAEPVKKDVKNLWGLLGNDEKKSETPSPSAPPAHAMPPDMKPVPRPTQAVDPEQVLRGKVWTDENACKKEALKGGCSSIDCATHTGGVCSGFTSMIWIYR